MGVCLRSPSVMMKEEDTPTMSSLKLLAIALSIASLTACKGVYSVIDQQVEQSTGHALAFVSSEESDEIRSSVAASSSEYVPPVTEACAPGEFQFRVWSCGPDGHRSYI